MSVSPNFLLLLRTPVNGLGPTQLQHDLILIISAKTLLPNKVAIAGCDWGDTSQLTRAADSTHPDNPPEATTTPSKTSLSKACSAHVVPSQQPPVALGQGMENKLCIFLRRLAGGSWYVSYNTTLFSVLPVDEALQSDSRGIVEGQTLWSERRLTSVFELRRAKGPAWQRPDSGEGQTFLKSCHFRREEKSPPFGGIGAE